MHVHYFPLRFRNEKELIINNFTPKGSLFFSFSFFLRMNTSLINKQTKEEAIGIAAQGLQEDCSSIFCIKLLTLSHH